ncbi:ATP-binding protein [Candidatus Mycoplasma mahonii]|uniref:ATP-binding protein n=1 Tax=Candidatus Mycoplasma mahonii TaxID=3004105 RepID=UPI0026ED5C71|nr:ATP-binding protein [Candidatus Mycoplasma mahonii]WKX02756.1 ATP-binding protein [Candidatus Mycoplasma mahonii]
METKLIKRVAYKQVVMTLKDNQIPLIIGLRRIGKTTILKQLNKEFKNSFYLSLDDFEIYALKDLELWNYLVDLSAKYDLLLLDEVQLRKGWDLIIKNLFDKFTSNNICKYVVTGSSSINLLGKEMGVNRIKRIYLDTWDFDEYLTLSGKKKTFAEFEIFLGRGFPAYIQSDKSIFDMLNETLKPIILNDIPKAFNNIDTLALMRFIKELSHLSNGEVNETTLANKVGITRVTAKNYLDILERASLIKIIFKMDERLIIGKKKTKKVYLNPHLHVWLLGKQFSEINGKYKGHIIESYWLYWATSINGWTKQFYYYQDSTSKEEIDFILLNPNGSIKTLHEFKYSDSPSINKTFRTTISQNKFLWCKETKHKDNYEMVSILDMNGNW